MINALEHPLVADYLRQLDTALASLPAVAAAELCEQIRAHLLEALPPDADEDAVTAVLAALGPASLVAAAAAAPASGRGEKRRDPPVGGRPRGRHQCLITIDRGSFAASPCAARSDSAEATSASLPSTACRYR